MNSRIKLLVLFGGASSEHEISRVSAASVLEHIDTDKYTIYQVGITKKGKWFLTEATPKQISDGSWEGLATNKNAQIATDFSKTLMTWSDGEIISSCRHEIDVVFPVLHGRNGEDGTIQGLLQLAGIPFVGTGASASAACMDKAVTKAIIDQAEVCQQARCSIVHRGFDEEEAAKAVDCFFEGEYPLFVKPANSGSSVGISKVKNVYELPQALHKAFEEDSKALVEEAIIGREIEVAVLGNRESSEGLKASCIGEIFAANEFYDYNAKYDNKASRTAIVKDLPDRLEEDIREKALKIYELMGCDGLSRVDFFLTPDENGDYSKGNAVFNEINTIPGFTSISMYPQLWEASGISYSELIDRLIDLAFECRR